jgi:hypothetical protein
VDSLAWVRAVAEADTFRPARYSDITVIMKKQTAISKKRRGPAPTGVGTPIVVRMHPAPLAALDAWIGRQDDTLTRPEAIRRLVEAGLKQPRK